MTRSGLPPRLSRAAGDGRPAPPVRLVHLGLGSFFRAHAAWWTDRAPDAPEWGYAAFTGRSRAVADDLTAQDGLYTVITRGPGGDAFDLVSSVARAVPAADHEAWLALVASPDVAVVTATVTEAAYLLGPDGALDTGRPEVAADVARLRRDPAAPVTTVPGRLVAGLAARRRADAGPLALVPCDNVAGNGEKVGRAVRALAELLDPALATWVDEAVAVVGTCVDRITPAPVAADRRTVAEATGRDDLRPVVTEPFHEWVLSGPFPAGRPRWEDVGAVLTDDVTPYEHRKLRLLNGAHSLLAYAGPLLGHETVAEAMADDTCAAWVGEWWDVAAADLPQPAAELRPYTDALRERFLNPRIRHLLAQVAADGSEKLRVRVVPTLVAERIAGRLPHGATRPIAAWACHLRGVGSSSPVRDARAEVVVPLASGPLAEAVPRLLDELSPGLGDDAELAALLVDQAAELGA